MSLAIPTIIELVEAEMPELEQLLNLVTTAIAQKKADAAVRAEGELLAGDVAADIAEEKKVGPPPQGEPGA